MKYYKCQKSELIFTGWSDSQFCPFCGTKLIEISKEEFSERSRIKN